MCCVRIYLVIVKSGRWHPEGGKRQVFAQTFVSMGAPQAGEWRNKGAAAAIAAEVVRGACDC
jgi:hypothetical protein